MASNNYGKEKHSKLGNFDNGNDSLHRIVSDFALNLIYLHTENDLVWHIAEEIGRQLGFMDCVVYITNEKKNILETKAASGMKHQSGYEIDNPMSIPFGKGIVGSVGANGIPEIIKDTRKDGRYLHDIHNNLSEIAIPIIYEDKVLGVIDSEHPTIDFFTYDHLLILTTIASMASTRIMNIRNEKKLSEHKAELEREVKKKTETLKNTIESLNRSNKDLESFAYTISHDLSEPLRTITGFLNVILSTEKKLSKKNQSYMKFVTTGVDRMNNMMEGLMEYSKLDYTSEDHEEINMDNIMLILHANLGSTITEKKAHIISGDLPSIVGNETQILQLFQNIIANGIKFHKEGIDPIIRIDGKEKAEEIEFTIQDNGIGMSPEVQRNIFELFYKEDRYKIKGSGIGLALCKKIVEYHRAKIEVVSEKNKGTCFCITFPKVKD